MSLKLVVGAVTDVGRVRGHNEDAYLVDEQLGLIAVADGMGGHQAGEVASATALEALRAAVTSGEGVRARGHLHERRRLRQVNDRRAPPGNGHNLDGWDARGGGNLARGPRR